MKPHGMDKELITVIHCWGGVQAFMRSWIVGDQLSVLHFFFLARCDKFDEGDVLGSVNKYLFWLMGIYSILLVLDFVHLIKEHSYNFALWDRCFYCIIVLGAFCCFMTCLLQVEIMLLLVFNNVFVLSLIPSFCLNPSPLHAFLPLLYMSRRRLWLKYGGTLPKNN